MGLTSMFATQGRFARASGAPGRSGFPCHVAGRSADGGPHLPAGTRRRGARREDVMADDAREESEAVEDGAPTG